MIPLQPGLEPHVPAGRRRPIQPRKMPLPAIRRKPPHRQPCLELHRDHIRQRPPMLTLVIPPTGLELVHGWQRLLCCSLFPHMNHCAEAAGPRRKNGTKPLIRLIEHRWHTAKMSRRSSSAAHTFGRMADECFGHPRLAAIYDPLDPDRSDLDAYIQMTEEFGARQVLDIGCGTGVFALLLAEREIEVVGVDPAQASIDVARAKPGSGRVRWICGDAATLPPMRVDLATMTANAAQQILDPQAWRETLRGAYQALQPGGRLVFETRDPARRAWEEWNREASYRA